MYRHLKKFFIMVQWLAEMRENSRGGDDSASESPKVATLAKTRIRKRKDDKRDEAGVEW